MTYTFVTIPSLCMDITEKREIAYAFNVKYQNEAIKHKNIR